MKPMLRAAPTIASGTDAARANQGHTRPAAAKQPRKSSSASRNPNERRQHGNATTRFLLGWLIATASHAPEGDWRVYSPPFHPVEAPVGPTCFSAGEAWRKQLETYKAAFDDYERKT
ncbi:hypothetical protein AAE478_005213 [Parahypoxylon ruwenzoriense]